LLLLIYRSSSLVFTQDDTGIMIRFTFSPGW